MDAVELRLAGDYDGDGATIRRPDHTPAWSNVLRPQPGAHGEIIRLRLDGNRAGNPAAAKQHGVLLGAAKPTPGAEPVRWTVRDVDVSHHAHGGIVVGADAAVEVDGLTGSDNGFGALVVVGVNSTVKARNLQIDHLNHEIEQPGGPSTLDVDGLEAGGLGVKFGDASGRATICNARVTGDAEVHTLGAGSRAELLGCTFNTLSLPAPRGTTLLRCTWAALTVLCATRYWALSPREASVVLVGCRWTGPIRWIGSGTLILIDCAGPAQGPWVTVERASGQAVGELVVVHDGAPVLTVTPWRPA